MRTVILLDVFSIGVISALASSRTSPFHLLVGTSNNVVANESGGGVGPGQAQGHLGHPVAGNNNLNINLPENNNAILRLEVELRDKNVPKYRRGMGGPGRGAVAGRGVASAAAKRVAGVAGVAGGGGVAGAARGALLGASAGTRAVPLTDARNLVVPLEKVSSNGGRSRNT